MTKYRARTCPKCNYYLGYSITKPIVQAREVSITSFCLNCNYKLPVRAVVQGTRRIASSFNRRWLQAADSSPSGNANGTPKVQPRVESGETPVCPRDYSRHLRAIGQELEKLRVATFNLECTGTSYLIRTRAVTLAAEDCALFHTRYDRLQQWFRIGDRVQLSEQEDGFVTPEPQEVTSIKYLTQDLERIDDLGRKQRLRTSALTDGHSLSQLLRTLGALVAQRNHCLLGISWRDLSICIIVETGQGKREIDVFRPDNLYDLWVRMYLRRENRALSDVPY